jgi:hypothetical protein
MVRWTVIEKAKVMSVAGSLLFRAAAARVPIHAFIALPQVCRMIQRDEDASRHRISRGALLCILGEIGLARSDTDEILVRSAHIP